MIDFNKEQFIKKYITRRPESLFAQDWEANRAKLRDGIDGKSVLVIGGAGSIGSQFIKSILEFNPSRLIVIDHNENGLTELTRDLRSDDSIQMPALYRTYPINFGHAIFS